VPYCSQAKRLIARIDTDSSTSLRRQACSHGAPQIRPQIETNGFVARAIPKASSSRPSATAVT
jgi:hypothetical protein